MAIRAVIWDMGGVLVRTEDYVPRERLAERLGMTRVDLENQFFDNESGDRAQLGEISIDQHWENIRQVLGLKKDEMEQVRDEFWGGDKLDMELVGYIRSLRAAYKTGLLSNSFSNLRRVVTEMWEIADAFDEIIISAEEGLVKPDARFYQLALERIGVAPTEAVFIDDMLRNIEGARHVGLHAVHFQTPEQARTDLEGVLKGG